jgi:bifunctional non-homologous end joining protein LigD
MLATRGAPPERYSEFGVEAKYDGQRGLAVLADGALTVWSRNGAHIIRTFPEIARALPVAVGRRSAVFDGEIVALGAEGVPSFSRLQQRWPQCRRPDAELLREVPVRFYAFDILALDGKNLTGLPYMERRAVLADATTGGASRTVEIPPFWTDTDPAVVLEAAAEMGLEGILCAVSESVHCSTVQVDECATMRVCAALLCRASRR